ncbi:DNA polymerase nu-like [Exaiptasia diaphana]|uniref:DNA-directed DNA polymerase family A palm domain-containing protein n=1 Tax=Exaiptasia diaphana TaxID=2652724 RepID=A0A913YVW6_EXADI|nr:DNA polymerase nu-like [Exaiptasia diaphana]
MQIPTHQYIVGKENESVSIFPREAFHSKEGWSFLAADFQSIELRLLAHLSNDIALLKVFNEKNSSDVFITLTSQWLNKRSESVQFQEREQTKRIVYSVIYGVGRERLAKNIGVSVDKAKEFMKSFLDKFPGISLFTRKCIEECKKNGYVCTIFKRKRWFPHINAPQFNLRAQAERQAVNFVVQGSAADICKSSMIEVVRSFKKDPSIRAR